MWNRILQLVGFCEPPVCKAAREALQHKHPDWAIRGTQLVRKEATRCVVAVFYEEPKIVVRPTRYKLLGVDNELLCVEELPCDGNSPYWIRGRK